MTPGVGPVYLGRRRFGCRLSSGLLPTQNMAITATKAEPAFIGKHNLSTLQPPIIFGLTPLASQTAMTWSQYLKYTLQGAWLRAVLEVIDF
ncbi:hypothetical protein TNCV_5024311 [Trichonephila clavipes]|nr:hypothetical protein TNCV_5024311 [Trichonephila clavipes]